MRYLAKHKAHATQAGLTDTYWRTSNDGKGRCIPRQRLPRKLRLLLYGRTHTEIDIIGAFYETIRRTASKLQSSADDRQWPTLPSIEQARHHLQQELQLQRPSENTAPIAKRLLHIAINAPATVVAKYLADQQYNYTSPIARLAKQVHDTADAVCKYLSIQPATHRQHFTARNGNFYHLENTSADPVDRTATRLPRATP